MKPAQLLQAVNEGLAQFSPDELRVFALAVLHGVPITQLSGSAERNRDLVIDAQKKLRKHLTEAGCGAADLTRGSRV